jgi:hypothetical protein
MDRRTGTPTSTLGGGGGTKLFCSQALNATLANRAKNIREAVTPFCEREGIIIPVPQFCLVLEKHWFVRRFSPPINTNNSLAVEPETENDTAVN